MSSFADEAWLTSQLQQQEEQLVAGGAAAAAPAGLGAAPAAGGPPAGLAGLMGNIFQQLQQVGACYDL